MRDPTCQAGDTVQVSAHGPWGPMAGLDPIQAYRVLAHALEVLKYFTKVWEKARRLYYIFTHVTETS